VCKHRVASVNFRVSPPQRTHSCRPTLHADSCPHRDSTCRGKGKGRGQGFPSRNRTPVHSTRRLDLQKKRRNAQNKWSVTWIWEEWLSRIIMITALAIMLVSWIAVSLVFCLFLCFAGRRPMTDFELSAENSTIMGKRLTADVSNVGLSHIAVLGTEVRTRWAGPALWGKKAAELCSQNAAAPLVTPRATGSRLSDSVASWGINGNCAATATRSAPFTTQ